MTDLEPSERTDLKLSILENAALLAMDRLAEFYRWAAVHYIYDFHHDNWCTNKGMQTDYTELELYNIWREGK